MLTHDREKRKRERRRSSIPKEIKPHEARATRVTFAHHEAVKAGHERMLGSARGNGDKEHRRAGREASTEALLDTRLPIGQC